MKKLLSALLLLGTVILSSCSVSGEKSEIESKPEESGEVSYIVSDARWTTYSNASELINNEDANLIYIANVTGISFQILDSSTGLPPTEETQDSNRELNTMYDVDVITLYKGNSPKSTQVRFSGGIRDYRVEEQVALLGKNAKNGIPIMSGTPKLDIGKAYLFILDDFDGKFVPTPINLCQAIYNLHDPFEKYYSDITAKDVISVFGKDKWDIFWAQWQKDNPGWETWLDKEIVNKILANEKPEKYMVRQANWSTYTDAQSLTDSADIVFTGRIVGMYFNILDRLTLQPLPSKLTKNMNQRLYTIYEVNDITTYKGKPSEYIEVKLEGGIKGYREYEQLEAVKGAYWESIPIFEGTPRLEIDKTYLFAVKQKGEATAYIMNPQQSIYNLQDPLAKHLNITAKDVISSFGQDKWESFWAQQQKDSSK